MRAPAAWSSIMITMYKSTCMLSICRMPVLDKIVHPSGGYRIPVVD